MKLRRIPMPITRRVMKTMALTMNSCVPDYLIQGNGTVTRLIPVIKMGVHRPDGRSGFTHYLVFTPKFGTYGRNREKLPKFGKCRVSFTGPVRPQEGMFRVSFGFYPELDVEKGL
ncbi:hypothetical protein [Oryza sativa Japonica Group]|uniref:Uncharacterized protein n=1 Tax=Oryza sativa subsp. japonica TaxID=39947 RepID=Q5ZB49_ORYSJ|nr:hypothetical protein [Oryza sativa Japonica Group]BAD53192.1 hypothetical protein [Oryza sativa Japonica Group]